MNLKQIEIEALHLSEEERAELAQKLLLSFDTPSIGGTGSVQLSMRTIGGWMVTNYMKLIHYIIHNSLIILAE